MRIQFTIVVVLLFTVLMVCADETLPVLRVGTDVYTNVTVTRVTATDIYFTHDKGMGNAKLKKLEPALQQHFNYDAAKGAAVEQQQKSANAQQATSAASSGSATDPKAAMEDAIARVKAIINQPVTQLPRTPDMAVSRYPNWFHEGAEKPDFDTVDIRGTQDLQYGRDEYISSDLNPGVVFRGREVEFNSMTKYFYVDRSVPKCRLSEAEMLEINRLYRIIGSCEKKLDALQHPEPPLAAARVYVTEHRQTIIIGAAGAIVLLLIIRALTKKRPAG
jgi:hypothetical protein